MAVFIILALLHFLAQRTCPQCNRILVKTDPMSQVKCVCGWIWH